MTIKIAYSDLDWCWSLIEAIPHIAELGFHGIEPIGLIDYREDEEEISDVIAKTGLELGTTIFGGSFVEENKLDRERSVFEQTSELLIRLGGRCVVVSCGKIRAGNEDNDWKLLVRTLSELGEIAAKLGVQLAVHPNVGTLILTPEQIARLAEDTDPQKVKFCFDTAPLAKGGGDPVQLFEEHIDRIVHVHFKDLKDGICIELGRGELDLPGVYNVLENHAYDGWISVELNASLDPIRSARISLNYLRDKLGIKV